MTPMIHYKFCSTVLKALKTFKVEVSETSEERITVINARADNGSCQQISSRGIKKVMDVTKSTLVKVACFANFRDVI